MLKHKISVFILFLASSLFSGVLKAQEPQKPYSKETKVKEGAKEVSQIVNSKKDEKAPLFAGIAISADLIGLTMKAMNTTYSNMEVAARLDFKEKFFPIFELGLGDCDKVGNENNNTFKTTAPYFRIGMDYNINKKVNGNRFFAGFRYAYTNYHYDYTNPDFQDPVWGVCTPLNLESQKGELHWLELLVGVETKLWSIVRLGWDLRYRGRIKQGDISMGEPWYVPGYGKNGSTAFGGTFKLILDVGKSAKQQKK